MCGNTGGNEWVGVRTAQFGLWEGSRENGFRNSFVEEIYRMMRVSDVT